MTINGNVITFKGKTFRREVEIIGDVEFIKWFNGSVEIFNDENGDVEFIKWFNCSTEIFNDENMELESAYEATIIKVLTPYLPII